MMSIRPLHTIFNIKGLKSQKRLANFFIFSRLKNVREVRFIPLASHSPRKRFSWKQSTKINVKLIM